MTNPTKHTKPIPVRIPPELLDRIDAIRPRLVPREAFVRDLLARALDLAEAGKLETGR